MKPIRLYCTLATAVACAASVGVSAQAPAPGSVGPVPLTIIHARTIFVSNGGSDRDLFPGVFNGGVELPHLFTGDQYRPYTEFYAALKATDDYQLVSDPSQADLVLEIRLTAPNGAFNGPISASLPKLRLVIYDTKSHFALWTINSSVEGAIMQKNQDKNLDEALTEVLREFLSIAGKAPAPTP